jgi:hypothetical protein
MVYVAFPFFYTTGSIVRITNGATTDYAMVLGSGLAAANTNKGWVALNKKIANKYDRFKATMAVQEPHAVNLNTAHPKVIYALFKGVGFGSRQFGYGRVTITPAEAAAITAGIMKLREERGIGELGIGSGINSGLAVRGEAGRSQGIEYTAMGDAVNVAARLQSLAEPGTMLVSDRSFRELPAVFEWEPLGEVDVKGRDAKVGVFVVRGLSAGGGRVPGLRFVIVGAERVDAAGEIGERQGEVAQHPAGVVARAAPTETGERLREGSRETDPVGHTRDQGGARPGAQPLGVRNHL